MLAIPRRKASLTISFKLTCRELRARVSRTATSSSNLSVVLTDHNIDPIARGFQWLRQLARCYGGLLLRAAAFFHRRLAIALLQIRKDNRQHELLLTVIVEFDDNVFVVAGKYAP